MTTVTIEYCVPCGFRERARDLEGAILSALETDIDALTMEMGDHGVFEVRVDGETVFDKEADEFDVDAVVRSVRDAL